MGLVVVGGWGIRSGRIVAWGLLWWCEEFGEVFEVHEDPLVGGVGGAFAFGDDDSDMRVVVFGFGVGFSEPLGWFEASAVILCFDDNASVVGVADVGDVPGVPCSRTHLSVDAVVEVVAEVVSDVAFESGSGGFC